MDLFTAIKERHSYRGLLDQSKVPLIHLRQIVEAGMAAPSGCNAQTTSFIIVEEDPVMDSLKAIVDHKALESAPNAIVIFSEDLKVFNETSFVKEDYSAAVENMLLAITALGYASVWLDGVLRRDKIAERVSALLGIPDKYSVNVILPVGLPIEIAPRKEKKSFEERAWYNRYGA